MTFDIIAMGGPAAPGGKSPNGLALLLPWVLIFVIFWFLIIRPQAKRQKEHTKMLASLVKGDEIVTNGGIHGTVQRVNEKEGTVVVKVSDETKLTLDLAAVTRKISPTDIVN
jgi:preprotein translocase subunit YajC